MYNFIAQGVGLMGAAVIILSYQCKKNQLLFLMQGLGGLLFAVNFLMLGATTAAFLNLVNLFRGAMLAWGNRFKSHWFAAGLIADYTVVTVFTFESWVSVLILVAQIVSTLTMWSRRGKWIRIGQLALVSPAWLINNIVCFSVGGIITESISILSVIVSLIRYRGHFEEKKEV